MIDRGEQGRISSADALGRRGRRPQFGKLILELLQATHPQVIVGIARGRLVQDVIAVGVLVDLGRDARVLLLGGPPFGEAIVMWWNFVGRSHEEVVAFRSAWMEQLADGRYADGRFGIPIGTDQPPIPAPELPNARLKERR